MDRSVPWDSRSSTTDSDLSPAAESVPGFAADAVGKANVIRRRFHRTARGPRGRTGCMTCRNRKKKCDGVRPLCENCNRLNYQCVWEEPRPPVLANASFWKTPPPAVISRNANAQVIAAAGPEQVRDSARSTTAMIPLFRSPDPMACWISDAASSEYKSNRREMLRYYIQTFATLLTTNLENNTFLSVFLPMSVDSPTLLNSLVAWSSSHLALRDESFNNLSLQLRCAAFESLSTALASSQRQTDLELASCLVLCSMESILGDTLQWYQHLTGAYRVICSAWRNENECQPSGLRDQEANESEDLDKIATTVPQCLPQCLILSTDGRCLVRNFAYHDILATITLDSRPLLTGYYWQVAEEHLPDAYFGLASYILFLVSEISVLSCDMKEAYGYVYEGDLDYTLELGMAEQVGSENMPGYSQRAFKLEQELLQWTCKTTDNLALKSQAEAYRNAALVYLYRTIRRRLRNLAEAALKKKISFHIGEIIKSLDAMDGGCLPECTLLFPMFLAGGEAESIDQYRLIRGRLLSIIDSRRFMNMRAAVTVLDELWRLRVSKPDVKVDWLDILKRRGVKLALS